MKKLNNKGFTLVEIIAVVVIIAVLGMVAVPSILSAINKSKDSTYNILVSDIATASQQLYEEIEYNGSEIRKYTTTGPILTPDVQILNNSIEVNLQTLVSNGFLTGSNNPDINNSINRNRKIIVNPKDKKDIGECNLKITKIVANDEVSYTIEAITSSVENCPSTADYAKVLK